MSYSLQNLPRFRKIAAASEVKQAGLLPNAIIVAEDTEQLFVDTTNKRLDLSVIRYIEDKDQLPAKGIPGKLYLTLNGSIFTYSAGNWFEYTPYPLSEATYMHRFIVAEGNAVEELRFSQETLGVPHCPEFDIIDTNGYNITGDDFISRRWEGNEYVVKYSGGWVPGEYFLKLSYNVRYDSPGIYITDKENTTATVNINPGETYVFEQPLTSLSVNIIGSGRGESSIWFKTGNSFTIDLPEGIKFFGAPPAFNTDTEYMLVIKNNTVAVGVIA